MENDQTWEQPTLKTSNLNPEQPLTDDEELSKDELDQVSGGLTITRKVDVANSKLLTDAIYKDPPLTH